MTDYDFFPDDVKAKVLQQINSAVPKFQNLLDSSYERYQLFEKKILGLNKYEDEIKKLLELSIFLSISWLEISFDSSIYLESKDNYKQVLSLKNLTIHLNEGYKKIYHFTESKRNKSLWIKNIVELCQDENLKVFLPTVDSVRKKIEDYENQYQNDELKDKRDVFVHYQGSPILVYEALNRIDVNSLFKNATDYLLLCSDIINLSTDITNKIVENYSR